MNRLNGWLKIIATGLITILLSIGSIIYTSGQYTEKVNQLECRVEKAERNYSTEHDLLIRISEKVDNIEKMIETLTPDPSPHGEGRSNNPSP